MVDESESQFSLRFHSHSFTRGWIAFELCWFGLVARSLVKNAVGKYGSVEEVGVLAGVSLQDARTLQNIEGM